MRRHARGRATIRLECHVGQRAADRPARTDSGAVEIGEFQIWILELREVRGAAVTSADIAIAGGMPGHGHGLPTQPRVTEELGGGRYRIEGVKLNMVGAWVIEVFVQTSASRPARSEPQASEDRAVWRDRLRFDLAVDY